MIIGEIVKIKAGLAECQETTESTDFYLKKQMRELKS